MTLATFHSDIAAVLARGASQEGKIPRWTRHAAQWLEQNYSFKYMERHGELWLSPEAETPNVVTLPNERIKKVVMIQPSQMSLSGARRFGDPLPKVDRRQVSSIHLGWPHGWWQVGNMIQFDGIVNEPFLLDMMWFEYTAWPTDPTGVTPLLEQYENLLFAQTLINAWRELKDPEAMATWTAERDLALRAVLIAEDENQWEAQDLRMEPMSGPRGSY